MFHAAVCRSVLSARNRCTRWTAIAPSPTADATRLTLPARVSPTANIPGTLVSSRSGERLNAKASASSTGSRAYCAPVAITTLRALNLRPESKTTLYGCRLESICTTDCATSIAPQISELERWIDSQAPVRKAPWESPDSFQSFFHQLAGTSLGINIDVGERMFDLYRRVINDDQRLPERGRARR